jgi:ribosomal protein L6P/L9E
MSSAGLTAIKRLSYIGKRPINFRNAEVAMSVSQISNAESERVKFGLLPFTRVVTVQGKLGSFDVRLVDGLNCELSEGMTHDESKISLNIDSLKYHAMNKYERKFLKSMHGTTNSILSRYVEGVSEVCSATHMNVELMLSFRAIK